MLFLQVMKRRFLIAIIVCALCSGQLLSAQNLQPRVEYNFIEAVSMYNNGDFEGARKLLTALIRISPQDDAINYYLGLCNFALRDAAEAERYLSNARQLDPGNYWYNDRLAALYAATGQVEKAVDVYEDMVARFPKNADPYYALVNMYASLDRTDKMTEVLERITEMSGESPQIYTMQGDANMSAYEDSIAMAYYDKALALDPDYAPAMLGKAEALRLKRRYDEYFQYLSKYMASDYVMPQGKSDYLQTLFHNMDGRFFQNFKPQLDSLANTVGTMHPQDSTVLLCLGSYYYSTGRPEEAKEYLVRNVDLYPDSYSARVMYVQFLSYTGELETMAEECEKAYAKFPFEPAFLEYKIMAYYNMQDYQGAIREGERMLSLYPNDPERQLSAYSTLGDMYYRVGDLKKCFDVYDKALKIDPDNALVLNNYAYFMCLTGKNLSKAYKMSKKAVELESDNASYLDTIGWILHLRGNDAEAKTYFKKAMIYGGKDSYECLNHYAQVLEKLGETELSKYYYDLAQKLGETE